MWCYVYLDVTWHILFPKSDDKTFEYWNIQSSCFNHWKMTLVGHSNNSIQKEWEGDFPSSQLGRSCTNWKYGRPHELWICDLNGDWFSKKYDQIVIKVWTHYPICCIGSADHASGKKYWIFFTFWRYSPTLNEVDSSVACVDHIWWMEFCGRSCAIWGHVDGCDLSVWCRFWLEKHKPKRFGWWLGAVATLQLLFFNVVWTI